MANDDRIITDQDFLDQEANDPLLFQNIDCLG